MKKFSNVVGFDKVYGELFVKIKIFLLINVNIVWFNCFVGNRIGKGELLLLLINCLIIVELNGILKLMFFSCWIVVLINCLFVIFFI